MNEDEDKYPEYLAGSDFDNADTPINGLEERVEQLEEHISALNSQLLHSQTAGIALYGLGATIAVVLSWSRNASILWCILHGILSWIYIVYFAFTR